MMRKTHIVQPNGRLPDETVMKRPPSILTWRVVALLVATATLGCNTPDYRLAKARRHAHIQRTVREFQAFDRRRPAKIRSVAAICRSRRRVNDSSLVETVALIDRALKNRRWRWIREAPIRRAAIKKGLAGKPEQIPEAWARMTY